MHELGILMHCAKTVHDVISKKSIEQIKQMTLEIGEMSNVVPSYMKKLFPICVDMYPFLKDAKLNIITVPGKELFIKEIEY